MDKSEQEHEINVQELKKLKESEFLYRMLFENAVDGIFNP